MMKRRRAILRLKDREMLGQYLAQAESGHVEEGEQDLRPLVVDISLELRRVRPATADNRWRSFGMSLHDKLTVDRRPNASTLARACEAKPPGECAGR
jgi:hypothetical protein